MRRLAVLGLVFVLALALIGSTASSLLESEDKVEVREELLEGSRAAARGLNVEFRSKDAEAQKLFWDTRFELTDGEIAPESDFEFEPNRTAQERGWGYVDMSLKGYAAGVSSDTDLLEYGRLDFPIMGADDQVISEMALDVAGRTERGTVRAETVRLRDYVGTFEWMLDMSANGVSIHMWDEVAWLSELFPVEVPEDLYMWVLIYRDDTGAVRRIEVTSAEGREEPSVEKYDPTGRSGVTSDQATSLKGSSAMDSRTVAAAGDGGIWVFPSEKNTQGEELVSYPNGRGLYFIPIVRGTREDTLDTAGARLMYATDEEPVQLNVSGGNVELVTRMDKDLMLTVLDGESGQVESRQTLFEDVGGENGTVVGQGGLLLYTLNDGRFVLTAFEDGVTRVALTGRFDFETVYGGPYRDHTLSGVVRSRSTSLAWDGRRLAAAEGVNYQEVIVVDAAGVIYHAHFEFSPLWNGRSEEFPLYDKRADSGFNEPMTVRFA